MTNNLILRITIICFLVLIWQTTFPSHASTSDTVTLQLKWKHQFQFAGYYAAIEKGYYKKKGIKVVLHEGKPGLKPVDELVSNRADFAVSLPDTLLDRQKGKPVIALAAIFQHSPLVLFTSKKSGIVNPQEISGKKIMEKKMVCINTIINDLLKILGKTLGDHVAIKTYLEEKIGAINADIGQIEQVLMNLAVNARDAMPKGGEIIIETKNLVLDGNYMDSHLDVEPGPYVMLAVSDNGEGMDRKILEHIFDPFYTTKEQGNGTGLGLSTVYGIIKQHNSHIYVYSEKNKGTTFKIYFPSASQPVESINTHRKTILLEPGNETIMVVDDEPSIRQLVIDTLEPLGYQCIAASNGQEAMETFQNYSGDIHLLITDVVMPGISGRELAEKISRDLPEIKVIFISGYTENIIVHHGVLDQGINYISKPLTPVVLTQKIREVLNKQII